MGVSTSPRTESLTCKVDGCTLGAMQTQQHRSVSVLLALALASLGLLGFGATKLPASAAVEILDTPTPTPDPLAIPVMPESPTQVDIGLNLYYYHCMPCHGDRGQGLTDEWRGVWVHDHQNCWGRGCHAGRVGDQGFPIPRVVPAVIDAPGVMAASQSAETVFDYLHSTHPPQRPGALAEEEYWALTAFLLHENGQLEAGDQVGPAADQRSPGRAGLFVAIGLVAVLLLVLWAGKRVVGVAALLFLVGCSTAGVTPTATAPTPRPTAVTFAPTTTPSGEQSTAGLTDEQLATLGSLQQVDEHPLYTMRYYGGYEQAAAPTGVFEAPRSSLAWACSLFAALGDREGTLFGRNFDWEHSPALLLFTDPPQGYASVAMVDIAYLGFRGARAQRVTALPIEEQLMLLEAPFWPFDGMNEYGMVVGMAAVPPGRIRPDPAKESIGSLGVIREILDHARDVDEAVAILESYNVDMEGGPPLHYLIADASGRAALVEFHQGELIVTPNEKPWHLATNFLRAAAGESATGICWRYDRLYQQISKASGQLTPQEGMNLLAGVSQGHTQWSIVYGMLTGEINVAMGRRYEKVHTFHLRLAGEKAR
jgi:hypothetical protein